MNFNRARKSNVKRLRTTALCVGVTLGTAAGLTACSLGGPLRIDKKAQSFSVNAPSGPWKEQKQDENVSDRVFVSDRTGSVIALGSVCKRYEQVSLEALRKDLMNPIDGREIASEERKLLDDREALFTRVKGRLDGVPVESHLVVLRKNDCIFDFSLHARNKITSEDDRDFMSFVHSFHFAGPSSGSAPAAEESSQ